MTSDHARRRSRSRSRGVESSAHLSYNGAMKVKPLLLALSLFGLVVHAPGLARGKDKTEWTKEAALQSLEKVSLKLRAEAESNYQTVNVRAEAESTNYSPKGDSDDDEYERLSDENDSE